MVSTKHKSNLVRIHSDAPAIESVRFGFDGYADTLAGLIANKKNETPLVMGIYGHWGSGKTTLMKTLQERLGDPQMEQLAQRLGASIDEIRRCKTVWFQAWKYEKESEILAGLLEAIFQAMAADDFFSQAKGEIEKLAKGLNKKKILSFVSKLIAGVDVAEFFSELEYKKELGFYDIFRTFFNDLIWTYLNWRIKITQSEIPDDSKSALVVFIDDLDRCPKSRIVKILETVKLFMDHKGCVFVIGAARDIIVKALAKDYGVQDANRFMEKIVQVTFNLPKVTEEMFEPYLDDLGESKAEISKYLTLIMPAMGYNPRQLKRFVNNLNLRHGLMRSSGLSVDFDSVLHWGIIEHAFPELADDLDDNPNNLITIKDHISTLSGKMEHPRVWEAEDQLLKDLNVPQGLHKYIRNSSMVAILRSFTIEKEDFLALLTFSGSVESDEPLEVSEEQEQVWRRTDTMVEIYAGTFKFGETLDDAKIDEPFWIDIYPVTNARFKLFIKDGGYETEKWWPSDGWQWRKKNRILRPEYWQDAKWNANDHPVVGVSWYEAAAFCCWLTEISNDGFVYQLPNEKQWERAARGTDGRDHPWEGKFDPDRCNTEESKIGKTTRVDRYANGVSPVGCYDMAGNVWEWTTEFFDDSEKTYLLKGGSWGDPAEYARCSFRFSDNYPDHRINVAGFRCARTKNKSPAT